MKNKFRGKILGACSGKHELDWAYGNLIEELETGRRFICDLAHFNDKTLLKDVIVEVFPLTVGQYLEQHDCNKKDMYHGDIVEINTYSRDEPENSFIGVITDYGVVPWFEGKDCCGDEVGCLLHEIQGEYRTIMEVVGNKYDNPELLEDK